MYTEMSTTEFYNLSIDFLSDLEYEIRVDGEEATEEECFQWLVAQSGVTVNPELEAELRLVMDWAGIHGALTAYMD